jgi:hypothetical protein
LIRDLSLDWTPPPFVRFRDTLSESEAADLIRHRKKGIWTFTAMMTLVAVYGWAHAQNCYVMKLGGYDACSRVVTAIQCLECPTGSCCMFPPPGGWLMTPTAINAACQATGSDAVTNNINPTGCSYIPVNMNGGCNPCIPAGTMPVSVPCYSDALTGRTCTGSC